VPWNVLCGKTHPVLAVRADSVEYNHLKPGKHFKPKEKKYMKSLRRHCIDCGSAAVQTLIDEIKPDFRMELVQFECGAEMKSSYSTKRNTGKVVHSGCSSN
jgi:hypothetical protein